MRRAKLVPRLERLEPKHLEPASAELIQRRTAHRTQADNNHIPGRHVAPYPTSMRLSAGVDRNEWKLATALPRADAPLAFTWYAILLLRGVLPALFAIAMGALVSAIQRGEPLTAPLAEVGTIFVLLQVLNPIHQAVR